MTSPADILIHNLEEMISKLEKNGEKLWSSCLRKSLEEMRSGDFHGVRRFLDAFGGMGSLNDCYMDSRFSELRSESYSIATALVKDRDK